VQQVSHLAGGSTGSSSENAGIDATTAWRLIVVAAIANLVFKAGIIAVLGSRRLMHYIGSLAR
jgi:uncharacterized membrane protein (DUF4010 family)